MHTVVIMPVVVAHAVTTAFTARRFVFAAVCASGSSTMHTTAATVGAAHFPITATPVATTTATAEATDHEAEREGQQAEEEDLGPVGVHVNECSAWGSVITLDGGVFNRLDRPESLASAAYQHVGTILVTAPCLETQYIPQQSYSTIHLT